MNRNEERRKKRNEEWLKKNEIRLKRISKGQLAKDKKQREFGNDGYKHLDITKRDKAEVRDLAKDIDPSLIQKLPTLHRKLRRKKTQKKVVDKMIGCKITSTNFEE